jgi:hypothetical protein
MHDESVGCHKLNSGGPLWKWISENSVIIVIKGLSCVIGVGMLLFFIIEMGNNFPSSMFFSKYPYGVPVA